MTNTKIAVHPVVLCGGSGTRLWPLSCAGFPKQFLCLTGNESLFQQAAKRLMNLSCAEINLAPLLVVSNEDHRFLVLEQLRDGGIDLAAALLEPVGRNPAPALMTLAALATIESGNDPILVVTPADQTVADQAAFADALQQAVREAASGSIVILGIAPDGPETGYGYIKVAPSLRGEAEAIHGGKTLDRHRPEGLRDDDVGTGSRIGSVADAAIQHPSHPFMPIYNIGTGSDVTIRELAEPIMDVVGFQGEIVFDSTKPDGTPRKLLDVSHLKQLGWQAKKPLRDGIVQVYAAYLAMSLATAESSNG